MVGHLRLYHLPNLQGVELHDGIPVEKRECCLECCFVGFLKGEKFSSIGLMDRTPRMERPTMREQINVFNSRCDHQHPFCKSGIWSVPTFSQSETKDAIYIAQEKYTRCGAVCPGTFTPVLTLRVTCSHFGVKPAQRPGSARRGCPARDPLSGAAPAVLPGAGVDKRQFS